MMIQCRDNSPRLVSPLPSLLDASIDEQLTAMPLSMNPLNLLGVCCNDSHAVELADSGRSAANSCNSARGVWRARRPVRRCG